MEAEPVRPDSQEDPWAFLVSFNDKGAPFIEDLVKQVFLARALPRLFVNASENISPFMCAR